MSPHLIVVDSPSDWALDTPGAEVVSASRYLIDPAPFDRPRTRVINLCRSLRYQHSGYYVSLLAEARGHKPVPRVGTLQELRSPGVLKAVAQDLEPLVEKALEPIASEEFTLSVYFGKNVAKRYEALAAALFRAFPVPLLRAHFRRDPKDDGWSMTALAALELDQVPDDHRETVKEGLADHLAGRSPRSRPRVPSRYDLAILRDPTEPDPASNPEAIKRFLAAAEAVGFSARVIGRHDSARLPEFDALFIRDTTGLNHYTFRFALKAHAAGLVVIDHPDAILKCTNKVFLAELLQRHRISAPRSMIVTRENAGDVARTLGLPCVLKQPDSAFSMGVTKAATPEELDRQLRTLLKKSALVIAQEFRPTPYDWRIGVLDGQPLYACRYFMAESHWQILRHDGKGGAAEAGAVETLPAEAAPGAVLDLAVRAASLHGDGLFGVDLKEIDGQPFVIEVNDNPTIDAGDEDAVLGDELYLRIMRHMMAKVEQRKRAGRLR